MMSTESDSVLNVAIIPCRGGSKRVPNKNIRSLQGKPLIAYAIEAALKSNVFSAVVVSTDSEEIAKVALQYGADIPFMRDNSLADDFSPVSAATVDALKKINTADKRFRNVAQLMATCPLRNATDVRSSYEQFIAGGTNSQISVTEYGWLNPWWAMKRNEQNVLIPIFKDNMSARSQDLPRVYCPTGAIWWAKSDILQEYGTFYAPNYTGWVLPWERAVDIDTEADWEMAEVLLARQREGL